MDSLPATKSVEHPTAWYRVRNLRWLLCVILSIQAVTILFAACLTISWHNSSRYSVELQPRSWTVQCDDPTKQEQLPPRLVAQDGQWQPVQGHGNQLFVFSAFWESPATIRVIGTASMWERPKVVCRVWFNNSCWASVDGRVEFLEGHHFLEYGPCFVLCPLDGATAAPHSVSIGEDVNDLPTNRVLVVMTTDPTRAVGLSVCVSPLYNHYNQTMALVEFIELNAILGAMRFFFYLLDVDPSVACILKHYETLNYPVIQLLPWDTLGLKPDQIHNRNQLAAINDCLHRNRFRSEFVAVVDTDEFIMPRSNRSLLQLIRWLDESKRHLGPLGSFVFRNAFFYLHPTGADLSSVAVGDFVSPRLVSVTRTRRTESAHAHEQHAKYVCRPDRVAQGGVHYVEQFAMPSRELLVDQELALNQHYRACVDGHEDCQRHPSVVDQNAHRYQSQLSTRVAERWSRLVDVCQLPDLKGPTADSSNGVAEVSSVSGQDDSGRV